jgi:hypothetical protein
MQRFIVPLTAATATVLLGTTGSVVSAGAFLVSSSSNYYSQKSGFKSKHNSAHHQLYANNPRDSSSNKGGAYVRPSAAIERGSGFFVPGLEGPKIQCAVGILGLVLSVLLQRYDNTDSIPNQGTALAQAIAVVYSFLALLQGGIQLFVVSKAAPPSTATATNKRQRQQQLAELRKADTSANWHSDSAYTHNDNNDWKARVDWAAQAYASLTKAQHMCLVQHESHATTSLQSQAAVTILYSLNSSGAAANNDDTNNFTLDEASCQQALDKLQVRDTVLLRLLSQVLLVQRISPRTVWIAAWQDRRPSQQDVEWLRQLAAYVQEQESHV